MQKEGPIKEKHYALQGWLQWKLMSPQMKSYAPGTFSTHFPSLSSLWAICIYWLFSFIRDNRILLRNKGQSVSATSQRMLIFLLHNIKGVIFVATSANILSWYSTIEMKNSFFVSYNSCLLLTINKKLSSNGKWWETVISKWDQMFYGDLCEIH